MALLVVFISTKVLMHSLAIRTELRGGGNRRLVFGRKWLYMVNSDVFRRLFTKCRVQLRGLHQRWRH
jgi:hypothetical protein